MTPASIYRPSCLQKLCRRGHAARCVVSGLLLAAALLPGRAMAEEQAIRATIEGFLLEQTAASNARVDIDISLTSAAQRPCRSPEAFLPGSGGVIGGRTTVGIRCPGDAPETRYFQANVSLYGEYPVPVRDMSPGDTIQASDLRWQEGELSRFNGRLISDPEQLIGQVTQRRIGAGQPLQQGMVKAPRLVDAGQEVTLRVTGQGFEVRSSGRALNSAGRGESVRIRTGTGNIVNGTAVESGVVEVR